MIRAMVVILMAKQLVMIISTVTTIVEATIIAQ